VDDLYHLNQLAVRLKLPRQWLRREATHGRIPCLRAGRRLLFSLSAVAAALAERAARERLVASEGAAGEEEVVVG
jgi:hypothetical protein